MLQYTMGLNNATKTSPTIINLGHCHTCTALPRGDYHGCGERGRGGGSPLGENVIGGGGGTWDLVGRFISISFHIYSIYKF